MSVFLLPQHTFCRRCALTSGETSDVLVRVITTSVCVMIDIFYVSNTGGTNNINNGLIPFRYTNARAVV